MLGRGRPSSSTSRPNDRSGRPEIDLDRIGLVPLEFDGCGERAFRLKQYDCLGLTRIGMNEGQLGAWCEYVGEDTVTGALRSQELHPRDGLAVGTGHLQKLLSPGR